MGTPVGGTVGAESEDGEVVKHTVTFNTDDGTEVEPSQVDNGGTVTLPDEPSKSGNRFGGWYTDASFTNKFVPTTKITTGMTLYAKWDLVHTVTFNTDGGTEVKSSQVANGGTVTLPEEPLKSGNRFDGWYTEASFANKFVPATPITTGMTLYAKWDLVQHTVTFDTNDGTEVEPSQVANGGTVTLPDEPSKSGNRFGGWYTDALFVNKFVPATPITTSMTLYAKWDLVHTVTFNTDGGTEVKSSQVANGGTVTLPEEPLKSGNRFGGWYTDALFVNKFVPATPITTSMTLYAKWDLVQHTVTFDTNDGTEVEPSQVANGGTVTLPDEPSKSGNRFGGWYTDALFVNKFVPATPITTSMTLYAKWDLVQHTVTFDTNDGTEVEPSQVANGGTVTLPDEPSKSGNRFGGWYTDALFVNKFVPATPITTSMTLYAKWDEAAPLPAYSFAFSARSHEVVFTSRNKYTGAVVETNKPAGDVRNIEYTSSDQEIATVNNAGVVTFIKVGTVTITATKVAEGEYERATASYELTITKMKPKNKAALSAEIERAIRKHGKKS